MADFNKKHIGSVILEKAGASPEYAAAFADNRTVMCFDAAKGTAEPLSSADRAVADRLEEERNYYTYAVLKSDNSPALYLVVTDEIVKLANINIEYGNDPFDGVIKFSDGADGLRLTACRDTPEGRTETVDVSSENGILRLI